jgi:glucokinase
MGTMPDWVHESAGSEAVEDRVGLEAPPVVALDIGGTKLAVGILSADGTLQSFLVEPTRREQGPERALRRLFDMGHRALAQAGIAENTIGAVGISCGGPLDAATGVLLCPPHLPGWIDVPVGPMAAADFGVPAVLANDATAGAWGEYRFGAGRGSNSIVYLTLSTGMGGGAVIDGKLHRGAAGNGGEFGHIMVRPGGRLCTCGRYGCIEAYASGTAIGERAAEAIASGRSSSLSALPKITAKDVAEAAATDQVARQIWDETTELLGVTVTDLVNVFEPDLVILGGGVSRSGSMLLDPVATAVAGHAMGPARDAVSIVLAGLGDAVCVVGAGALALDRLVALPRSA